MLLPDSGRVYAAEDLPERRSRAGGDDPTLNVRPGVNALSPGNVVARPLARRRLGHHPAHDQEQRVGVRSGSVVERVPIPGRRAC
jgi:hypothetical protein